MATTAIARYPNIGPGIIGFDRLPAGTSAKVVPLTAEDKGESKGVLYTRGGETTVVCAMHPRVDMSRHYAMPALLEGGYAAFGQEGRWPGNDIACIHEMLLADIAAAMRFLKEVKGFRHVVLLGNSGGGSLYSFYQAQAVTPPPARLTDTAAGDPYDLNRLQMLPADGIIHLAAHLGEGRFLMQAIDPSVTDESDPLSCDPSLDMYNPSNGFREPPESSKYSSEFFQRYRQAQQARIARLDAIARGHVEEQRHFQELARATEFEKLPQQRKAFVSRRAVVGRYMTINRTDADLAYCDLSIKPSARDWGSLLSLRPDLFNYMEGGFGKYQTPRAWLSTWSGLSSRAATIDNLPRVTVPTLVINYDGDHGIFPEDSEAIYQNSPARDKTIHHVMADHFGFPLASKPNQGGRPEATRLIVGWLRERFTAAP